MNAGSMAVIWKWRPSRPNGGRLVLHAQRRHKIKTLLTVFWLRRCCPSWVYPSRTLIRSTTSMFFISWVRQYNENGHSCGQLVIGSFIMTMCLLMHHVLWRLFWWNVKSHRWLSPLTAQIWYPVIDFWLFPKLISPLKGKRFQTIDKIQENTTGQLMAVGRTVWGPKVLTLKGTEALLSYVQCFLYLLQQMSLFFILHGRISSGQTLFNCKTWTWPSFSR